MLAAMTAVVAGCGGSGRAATTTTATKPAQRITVSASDAALAATGVASVRAGFVRIVVRNESQGAHGIALVRLKRPLTTPQLLREFAAEDRALLESLGGIQAVEPGRPWEMTVRLASGSYALVDYGQNGPKPNYALGFFKRFRVASSSEQTAPPATVGEIGLRDFRFDFRLPQAFSGKGTVKIENAGKAQHEITLVRIDRKHTKDDVLNLILAGATAPPKWATIVELLGVLDPGKTAYPKFDLRPGRYVALCLIDEPGSHKLHAQLGMADMLDVR
jgi:hypothetical protein